MTHKNLLPTDTRAAEIISGISLLSIAFLILVSGSQYLPAHMSIQHDWRFWGIVSGIFGALQIGIVMMHDSEHARASVAWLTGSYWIWSGANQLIATNGSFYDSVLIILGVSCMYAFIVNLLITSEKDQQNGNDNIT